MGSPDELDIGVRNVPGMPGEQARQAHARGHAHAPAVDPGRVHPRIVTPRQADDERPAGGGDGSEVVHAGVAAIREEQPVSKGRGIREKRAFRVRVGRDRDVADIIGESTIGRVHFDGRRFDRREPSGEGGRQGGL